MNPHSLSCQFPFTQCYADFNLTFTWVFSFLSEFPLALLLSISLPMLMLICVSWSGKAPTPNPWFKCCIWNMMLRLLCVYWRIS